MAGPGRPTTAGSGSWPSGSDDLAAALDGDGVALGVLENTFLPRVETAAEVREAVRSARFR